MKIYLEEFKFLSSIFFFRTQIGLKKKVGKRYTIKKVSERPEMVILISYRIDFIIKLLSETKESILLWNLGRSKQIKTHYICMDWKT